MTENKRYFKREWEEEYYIFDSTNITEEDFEHLQEIMISANELSKKAPYEKLVHKVK